MTSLRTLRSPAATAADVRASRRIGRANRRAIAFEAAKPQRQGRPAQRQQQPAEPVDRLVGLGGVDLGDQSPAGKADTHRPVGHQHVLAAIVGRPHEAELPAIAASSDGNSLAATSATGIDRRGGKMRRIASPLVDADQDFAGFVQAAAGRIRNAAIGPKSASSMTVPSAWPSPTADHRREHNAEGSADPPRRDDQAAIRFLAGSFSAGNTPATRSVGSARGKHLAGLVLDPESQKARSCSSAHVERIGSVSARNRSGVHRPAGALGEELVDASPVGELRRPLLLLLQRVRQHLLPIGGDRREPLVDLVCAESRWWRRRRRRSARAPLSATSTPTNSVSFQTIEDRKNERFAEEDESAA